MTKAKAFTLENLRADSACDEGIDYVTAIGLLTANTPARRLQLLVTQPDWWVWAYERGYMGFAAKDLPHGWSVVDDALHVVAGYGGTATAGDDGTATAGDDGTATAGNWGTATAGNWGTATAGNWGTASAGNWGTASAGNWGTATAGYGGTATAGYGGIIQIRQHDGIRYRIVTGYIGEDGLEPNTPYRLDAQGKFVEAKEISK